MIKAVGFIFGRSDESVKALDVFPQDIITERQARYHVSRSKEKRYGWEVLGIVKKLTTYCRHFEVSILGEVSGKVFSVSFREVFFCLCEIVRALMAVKRPAKRG